MRSIGSWPRKEGAALCCSSGTSTIKCHIFYILADTIFPKREREAICQYMYFIFPRILFSSIWFPRKRVEMRITWGSLFYFRASLWHYKETFFFFFLEIVAFLWYTNILVHILFIKIKKDHAIWSNLRRIYSTVRGTKEFIPINFKLITTANAVCFQVQSFLPNWGIFSPTWQCKRLFMYSFNYKIRWNI